MEPEATRLWSDDREVVIQPGDTIAAALTRAGILSLRRSRRGMPRGFYCGIGLCHECLVTLAGGGTIRACVTAARPGMRVRTAG
jgi:predicted molibdopterin-dependent oxidoreductase YjgC